MTVKEIVDAARKVKANIAEQDRRCQALKDNMVEAVAALNDHGCRIQPIARLPLMCRIDLTSDRWALYYQWSSKERSWLSRRVDVLAIVYNVVLGYRLKTWQCLEIGPLTHPMDVGEATYVENTVNIMETLVDRYLDK